MYPLPYETGQPHVRTHTHIHIRCIYSGYTRFLVKFGSLSEAAVIDVQLDRLLQALHRYLRGSCASGPPTCARPRTLQ